MGPGDGANISLPKRHRAGRVVPMSPSLRNGEVAFGKRRPILWLNTTIDSLMKGASAGPFLAAALRAIILPTDDHKRATSMF